MKRLVAGFILVITLAACSTNEKANSKNKSESEKAYIDKSFTKTQIDSVIARLQNDGISLQFTELKYGNDNIVQVSGVVKSGLQNGSFSSDNFSYLIISEDSSSFEIEIE